MWRWDDKYFDSKNKTIGKFIQTRRCELKKTISEAAREINSSPSYIRKIEGEHFKKGIPPIILSKLAPVLEISYIDLLKEAGYLKHHNRKKINIKEAILENEDLTEEFKKMLLQMVDIMLAQKGL